MWKLSKVITFVVMLVIVISCSKTQDDKKDLSIKTDAIEEKATGTHDHDDKHNHKEGELCIDPVAGKVASLSMDGKYEEAIQVLIEAKDVPGYQWDAKRIYDSIIYLYDKTKQYEKNLDIWRDGHSKGLIFNMDITKEHFKPYLELEGFAKILDKDNEMQMNEKKNKK